MTTGLGQNCVTRGRGPLEIPFCKPQIGAKTETWLENSWRRSDNIVGDLEENYAITFHDCNMRNLYCNTAEGCKVVHHELTSKEEVDASCYHAPKCQGSLKGYETNKEMCKR